MTATLPPNLRERKKAETWTTLHEAAAALAQQKGLEQATVEAIAQSAGVSPRTFFNYFPAKEDAVLGLHEPVLDPAEAAKEAEKIAGQASATKVKRARGNGAKAKNGAKTKNGAGSRAKNGSRAKSKPRAKS